MMLGILLTVVTNATPTTGTLLVSTTYVIDAGQTLELLPGDLVIDGVPSADVRLRPDRIHAPEVVAVSLTILLNVEVLLKPPFVEVMKPEEDPNSDAPGVKYFAVLVLAAERLFDVSAVLSVNVESTYDELFLPAALCLKKLAVLFLVAERLFDVDAVLSVNVKLAPDEPFPPVALLVPLSRLVGFKAPEEGM